MYVSLGIAQLPVMYMQHVSARQDRYEEGEVPKFTCRHVTVVA
jgi:hypothetical protein